MAPRVPRLALPDDRAEDNFPSQKVEIEISAIRYVLDFATLGACWGGMKRGASPGGEREDQSALQDWRACSDALRKHLPGALSVCSAVLMGSLCPGLRSWSSAPAGRREGRSDAYTRMEEQ